MLGTILPPKTDIFMARLDPTTKRLKHVNTVLTENVEYLNNSRASKDIEIKNSIQRNILLEDNPTNEDVLKCEQCDMPFAEKNGLRGHTNKAWRCLN